MAHIIQQTAPGVFEVNTAVMPFFIASDAKLLQHVTARLTQSFVGRRIQEGVEAEMSRWAVSAILEYRPIKGLEELLRAIGDLDFGSTIDAPDLGPRESVRRPIEVALLEQGVKL